MKLAWCRCSTHEADSDGMTLAAEAYSTFYRLKEIDAFEKAETRASIATFEMKQHLLARSEPPTVPQPV
jgi:hypothetical protein